MFTIPGVDSRDSGVSFGDLRFGVDNGLCCVFRGILRLLPCHGRIRDGTRGLLMAGWTGFDDVESMTRRLQ